MSTPADNHVDLCLASREDILLELKKRYGSVVLITSKITNEESGASHLEWDHKTVGGYPHALGLLSVACKSCELELARNLVFEAPPKEDEDNG